MRHLSTAQLLLAFSFIFLSTCYGENDATNGSRVERRRRSPARYPSRPMPNLNKFFSDAPSPKNADFINHEFYDFDVNIGVDGSKQFQSHFRPYRMPQQYQKQVYRPLQAQQQFLPQQVYHAPHSQLKRTITKHFHSTSTTDHRGTITTIWYYGDKESFTFSIKGPLPVDQNQMIDWIELNSKDYILTPIPYVPYGTDSGQAQPEDVYKPLPPPQSPTPRPQTPYVPPPQPPYVPPPQPEYRPLPTPPRPRPTPAPAPPPEEYIPPQVEYPEEVPARPLRPKPATSISISIGSAWDGEMPTYCGKLWTKGADKIYGGQNTIIQKNPWQCAILRTRTNALQCGGTIITQRHVVTAAHCLFTQRNDPLTLQDIRILAGSTALDPSNQELLEPQELFTHGKYSPDHKRNDISIIFLKVTLTFSPVITPICIPRKATADYKAGRTCTATGWGTREGKPGSSPILQSLAINITSEEQCKHRNEPDANVNITKGMFCAGDYFNGGKDTCQGDSGGPFTCVDEKSAYLYGITSWGVGCATAQHPGVYVNVASYKTWIDHILERTKTKTNKNAFIPPEPEPEYFEVEGYWDEDVT